jgi:membrane protein
MQPAPVVGRIREAVSRRWREANDRHAWLRHVVVAWARFQTNHGGQFAAAITYFSFLSLIPLVLLAVSIGGFVLARNPDQLRNLLDHVTSTLPGSFGDTLKDSINTAIANRTSVGVIGLAGLLLTGLGWIANLRAASNAVWGVEPTKGKLVKTKLGDLIALVGLGIGSLISIGLTAGGTALASRALDALGIDFAGAGTLTAALGIILALAGDMVIFWWLLVRLPRVTVPRGVLLRGALLASVGFEVLKLMGTWYIAQVNKSPAAGVFGSVIGILVWVYLVARYLLFCAAWTATALPAPQPLTPGLVPPQGPAAQPPPPAISPTAVAASLVGTGVAIGAAAVAWLTTRRRRG